MKLFVFCPHYPPYIGGLETHAAEFNKYMAHRKELNSILVYTSQIPSSTLPFEKQRGNIEIIRFPAFHIIPNYPVPKIWLPSFWHQWWQLYQSDVDLVISRTRFSFTSFLALILAKTRRKPWVHIEHGSDYVQLSSRFFSKVAYYYDRSIGWMIFHFSTQNVAISKAVQSFIGMFDRRTVPIIYRGVESEVIENCKPDTSLKKRYKNKTIVIFVGRLIDGKGVTDFISAIAKLKNEKIVGIIVGDGPQRIKLQKLAHSLNLHDQIYFSGQQPLKKAIAMVKAADIFINPSYTEGLPSAVIEAALCRRCIIATDVGGTREIIQDKKSGFLIPPRNIDRLAGCLRICLASPDLRKKMGDLAYIQAKRRFSWVKSCDTYIDIFQTVLASQHRKNNLLANERNRL